MGFFNKVLAQVNPFDNGKTFKNSKPAPQPAPKPQPKINAQALAQAFHDAHNGPYTHGPAFNQYQNLRASSPAPTPPPAPQPSHLISGLIQGIPRGLVRIAESTLPGPHQTFTPHTSGQKLILGKQPIQPYGQEFKQHGGAIPGAVAVAGSLLGDVPIPGKKEAAKAAGAVAKDTGKAAKGIKIGKNVNKPQLPQNKLIQLHHGTSSDVTVDSLRAGNTVGRGQERRLLYASENPDVAREYAAGRGTRAGNGNPNMLTFNFGGRVLDQNSPTYAKDLGGLISHPDFQKLSGRSRNQLTNIFPGGKPYGALDGGVLETNHELTKYLSDHGVDAVKIHHTPFGGKLDPAQSTQTVILNPKKILRPVTQPAQGAKSVSKSVKSPATAQRVSATNANSHTLKIPRPSNPGSEAKALAANSSVNNTTNPLSGQMPEDFLTKSQAQLPLSGKGITEPKPRKSALHSSQLTDLRDNAQKGILPEKNVPINDALRLMGEQPQKIPASASKGGDLPPVKELGALKYLFSNKVNALRATNTPAGHAIADSIQNIEADSRSLRADWMRRIPTVQKLNKEEHVNFADAVQATAKPMNAKVAQAVKEWKAVSPDVYQKGLEQGLPIGERANYYPRSYDIQHMKGSQADSMIQWLMDTNRISHNTATKMFKDMQSEAARFPNRFGHFENARLTNAPGYHKDLHSINNYLEGAARRIAESKHFGLDNEIVSKHLDNLRIQGGDYDAAVKAVQNYLRNADRGRGAATLRGIRGAFGSVRLTKAAISHAGQTSNTAVEDGIGRTLKGWGEFLGRNPEHRDFIAKTGVINPQELHSYRNQFTSVKGAMSKITAPGLTPMMKINRSVTALAGRELGNHLAEVGNVGKLRELGVEGEIGRKLSPEQEVQAARGLVDHTMFSGSRATTPILAETPLGKVVGQYRLAYAYKQTGFIYNQVIKEAGKGNLAPLMRYLAVSAPIGYGTIALKNKISGNQEGPGGKAMDTAAALGGLPGEAALQLLRYGIGHKDLVGALAGEMAPLAGEVVAIANALNKGKKAVEQYVLKLIPGVGSRASKAVDPPSTSSSLKAQAKTATQPQTGIYKVKAKDGSQKFATLQGQNLKSFTNLKDAQTAQAKNKFKFSNKKTATIDGQQYHKTSDGKVVKGALPPPKAQSQTSTTYDPNTNTWTETNKSTGKITLISADGTRTVAKKGLGTIKNARPDYITAIHTSASKQNLDIPAVMAVAATEGLGGGVGDGGTSFGPFQLHVGGALPPGKDQAWAESPAGIDYAVQQIAKVTKGKSGQAAIAAIVNSFERPADPNGEIQRALAIYNGSSATLASGAPRGAVVKVSKASSGSRSSGVKAAKTATIKMGRLPSSKISVKLSRVKVPKSRSVKIKLPKVGKTKRIKVKG